MSELFVEPAQPPARFLARLSNRLAMHVPVSPFFVNEGPLVSITFDDFPLSAYTHGASILEERGLRGTFYANGNNLGRRAQLWQLAAPDAVADLHARGHEIGCHTFSHHRADMVHGAGIEEEVTRNRAALEAIVPDLALKNFAYPFGYGSFAWKRKLNSRFDSARGATAGVNRGWVDRQFLKAYSLFDAEMSADDVNRALEETAKSRGWTIFLTHDVDVRPTAWGCSPRLLTHTLEAAKSRGIAVVSVAEALRRLGAT